MACKRITISLTEEQFDKFRMVLPAKANISEVLADQIGMFVDATSKYGDDFILDVMCNRGGYSIQKRSTGISLKTSGEKSGQAKSKRPAVSNNVRPIKPQKQ